MSDPNWGMLSKAQDDAETVEEAIARLIAVHESDEEAHLGTGDSLQSHKAAEIIDHLAKSVLRDKLNFHYFTIDTIFESIDAWTFSGNYVLNGLNALEIYTAASLNSVSYGYLATIDNQQDQAAYENNPNFEVRAYFPDIDEIISYIGPIGEAGVDGFGFKQVDNKLYAYYADDSGVEQLEEIYTLTGNDNLFLRCSYDYATKTHYWYINAVLEYSEVYDHSVNPGAYVMFYVKTTDTSAKSIWLGNLHYDAEMSAA